MDHVDWQSSPSGTSENGYPVITHDGDGDFLILLAWMKGNGSYFVKVCPIFTFDHVIYFLLLFDSHQGLIHVFTQHHTTQILQIFITQHNSRVDPSMRHLFLSPDTKEQHILGCLMDSLI